MTKMRSPTKHRALYTTQYTHDHNTLLLETQGTIHYTIYSWPKCPSLLNTGHYTLLNILVIKIPLPSKHRALYTTQFTHDHNTLPF